MVLPKETRSISCGKTPVRGWEVDVETTVGCLPFRFRWPICLILLCQRSTDDKASLDCELGEEMLSGEAKVANLWSVSTAQEALGKFG